LRSPGRSTIHAKTTAAEIGIEVMAGAGLDWMLADDTSTPQKFIRDRTQHVPENYKKLTGDDLRLPSSS
jgi:2-keto-3-deoxy-L-rhamnonate aldolase RhmA